MTRTLAGHGKFILAWYDVPMLITWRVDELAAGRGWSARRLAEAAGLDQKTVRNILAGRATRVDLDTVARLAGALDVPPGALWRTVPDRQSAWDATSGSAGPATGEELEDVLAGRWSEYTEPGLERATRAS